MAGELKTDRSPLSRSCAIQTAAAHPLKPSLEPSTMTIPRPSSTTRAVDWDLVTSRPAATGASYHYLIRFAGGIELNGPTASTPGNALKLAAECVDGMRPWDDHVDQIASAFKAYMGVIDAVWLYDHAPNVAEMLRELMAGEAVGARFFNYDHPPALVRNKSELGTPGVLTGPAAALGLAVDLHNTFRRDVETLDRVERTVIMPMIADVSAAAARRHPMWGQMLEARARALTFAGIKAWELAATDLLDMDATMANAHLQVLQLETWAQDRGRRLLDTSAKGRARRARFCAFPGKLIGWIDAMLERAPVALH
jgi:hypothetical protein